MKTLVFIVCGLSLTLSAFSQTNNLPTTPAVGTLWRADRLINPYIYGPDGYKYVKAERIQTWVIYNRAIRTPRLYMLETNYLAIAKSLNVNNPADPDSLQQAIDAKVKSSTNTTAAAIGALQSAQRLSELRRQLADAGSKFQGNLIQTDTVWRQVYRKVGK